MRPRAPGRGLAALVIVAATLAVRAPWFGDPVIDADEQFYLLVGDRWWHGAVPYVAIWDRKPPGLFLLYAAIRLLGGDGVVQYQLVATAFVAATALLIAALARRIAGGWAATGAAVAYPLMLGWSGGMGGQSPVFYNLPMVAAAMLVLRRLTRPDARGLAAEGAGAMLLVGVAMQVKYSAVFEGVYFGLALLWIAWRRGVGLPRTMMLGALWTTAAILPTALALAVFAAAGHGQAFVFANFTSILLRQDPPAAAQAWALAKMLARLSPEWLALAIAVPPLARGGGSWRERPAGTTTWRFVLGWTTASAGGILVFGSYFNHYALPLMAPLAVLLAPAFALRIGPALAALVLVVNGVADVVTWRHIVARSGDRAYAQALAGVVRAHLRGGALYVFNGEPILYHLVPGPLPTRWIFPYHLSFDREAGALGVDPVREVARIMAARPAVVVDTWDPADPDVNRTTQRLMRGALARDYRLVAAFRLRSDLRLVYARVSGP